MDLEARPHEVLPLFVEWTAFLKWLLTTTEKFPKKVRFTFTTRVDNLALDVLEMLIVAAYTKRPQALLRDINVRIDKLRVLLRLCYELRYLRTQAYKHACVELDKCGRMTGGWARSVEKPSGDETNRPPV